MSLETPAETPAGPASVPPAPLGRVGRALAVLAGLMIAAMMFITAIDVIGRYFLRISTGIAFQTTEILMGLVIFAGMPLATAAREHVSANFLELLLTTRGRCLQAAAIDMICVAIAVVLAWRVFERGQSLVLSNEVFLEFGGLKRGYVAWAMAALILCTALAFVWAALVALRAARSRP